MRAITGLQSYKDLAKVMKCSPERLIAAHLELALEPVLSFVKTGEGMDIDKKVKESIKHLRALAELFVEQAKAV